MNVATRSALLYSTLYGSRRRRMFCRFGCYIGCLGLVVASGTPQSSHGTGASEESSGALIQALAFDIRALRVELIEFRIEVQERTLPALDRELKTIAAEHSGLAAEESQLRQQLHAFDLQSASGALTPDEDVQAQQLRSAAGVSSVDIVRAKRAELASRQRQLEAQIRTEMQRLHVLQEKAKALSARR